MNTSIRTSMDTDVAVRPSPLLRRYYAAIAGALACALVAITVLNHLMGPHDAAALRLWAIALLGVGAIVASLSLARYAFRLDGELASAMPRDRAPAGGDAHAPRA